MELMKRSPKISYSVLSMLRSKRFAVVDPINGGLIEDIFEGDLEKTSKRIRISYGSFGKMNYKLNIILRNVDLSASARSFLLELLLSVNYTNSIDWANMAWSERCVIEYRKEIKKIGIIDKIKLGNVAMWYMNPFVLHKSKTVDPKLAEHFKHKLDYLKDLENNTKTIIE